jgi:hypothetical protein
VLAVVLEGPWLAAGGGGGRLTHCHGQWSVLIKVRPIFSRDFVGRI